MKILIAIDHFKDGGAERVASILINLLSGENDVHVVVMETDVNYPLNKSKIIIHPIMYNHNSSMLVRQIQKLISFRKIISEFHPDVILSFANYMSIMTYAALIANGRNQVRFITSERTDPQKEPTGKIYRLLRNVAYGNSDVLVCQTQMAQNYFLPIIKTQIEVIPNPITPNLPQWRGQNSKIIMTACRLVPQKNLPLLIRAFKKVHNKYSEYRLRIVGEGIMRNDLLAIIKDMSLEDSVSLPGFSKNIHNDMTEAYMYVSSSNYEGISNSMLEALGCGLPTICTDCPVGGAAMFIKDHVNGLLVPVGNEDALVEAMTLFIENKELAASCGEKARGINKLIDASSIGLEWLKCIEKCK